MNHDYDTQETPRGGVFHLHHKRRSPTAPRQKDMAFEAEPLALVAETAPDTERIAAEARSTAEAQHAAKQFQAEHQMTLV
jgi:fructose-1,6-bisphosphatase